MPNIVQFIPKNELGAAENLKDFIKLCREELTIFGPDLEWDADAWDVTKWTNRSGRKGRTAITFSNFDTSKQQMGQTLSAAFLNFSKAYMRYQHGMKPTKVVGQRMDALRALERALVELYSESKVEKTNAEILNRSCQLVKEKFASSTAYRVGSQIQLLANFLVDNHLVADSFIWKNPIKRDQDKNRVGKKADNRHLDMLPSEAGLEALPRIYNLAVEPPDIIVTSVVAILCGAADRINEVFKLSINCEVFDKWKIKGNSKDVYGLRWWPSKGADPMVKWIIGTMVDVVKDAISKLRKETKEARKIAKWYEENPGRVYLPQDCLHLREKELLSPEDIGDILGANKPTAAGHKWADNFNLRKIKSGDGVYFYFSEFEKQINKMLPEGFPFLNKETNLKYSDALLIVLKNTFHQRKHTYNCMFEMVTTDVINNQLGRGLKHGKSSIFSRFDFVERDGKPISIKSHEFRHWLNTLAQKGGLSQLDIAKWSGRKDIRQNEVYDHISGDELVEKVRNIDDGSMFGPLAEFVAKAPISRKEFMELNIPTAHSTELGFCIHDWTMMPCQRHADCINCTEQICIKGNEEKTARIKQILLDAEYQLENAEKAVEKGSMGADRWFVHHRLTVERLRNLWAILSDPKIPKGSVIQLANDKEYSPIKMAIEERIKIGDSDSQLLSRIHQVLSHKKVKELEAPKK